MISTEMLHASAAYELTSLHMLEVGDIVDFYFSRDRHQSLFFVYQENSGLSTSQRKRYMLLLPISYTIVYALASEAPMPAAAICR